jgi:hypothetical protein
VTLKTANPIALRPGCCVDIMGLLSEVSVRAGSAAGEAAKGLPADMITR